MTAAITAIALMASIILPVVADTSKALRYELSPQAAQIVKPTDGRLMKQVTYDAATQKYQFNKDGAQASSVLPAEIQKTSLGTPGGKDTATFAADLPTDLTKGVTYHDVNSQLDFTLIPQFTTTAGQATAGRIVYPIPGGMQAVYTLKSNGVKEDIIVEHTDEETLNFAYTLQLPKTLEAKMMGNGSLGLYSADPTLFGSMTYGSDADKQAVQKARENSNKTSLVFILPAPTILGPDGNNVGGTHAEFKLEGTTLTVVATGVNTATTPVSIDPSVVVTSTSDFMTDSNNEGMIDYSTAGQISRSGITGGTTEDWAQTTSFATARNAHQTVAYHGYLYVIGGAPPSVGTDVQFAPIATDGTGTVGTWQTTTSLPDTRSAGGAVLYNGYLYLIGGTVAGADSNTVIYSEIADDGTLGAWNTTTSFATPRRGMATAVFNGYVYMLGGTQTSTGTTKYNDVQYAPIYGSGQLGAWATTTAFATVRQFPQAAAYNGYLYIGGGQDTTSGAASYRNDIQYAAINGDGTIGAWVATSAFTTGRQAFTMTAYNGYLYILGGTGVAYMNDVQYAQINADGTLGAWAATASIVTAKSFMGTAALNGYIYLTGGFDGSVNYDDVIISKIDDPGSTTPFAAGSTTIATPRSMMCSAAYGGYIYAFGGSTTNNGNTNQTTIYAATVSTAGVLGAWTSITAALPEARSAMGCTIYNGFIYIVDGYTGAAVASNQIRYATISATTIGAWTTTGTAVTTASIAPGVFTYTAGNVTRLYVIGGSIVNSYYTTLAATGAPGTWTAGASLPNAWTSRAYAMIGDTFYAMGGLNGTVAQTTVYRSQLTSTGTMGAWTATGNTSLNTAVASMNGGVSVNGCLYVVGGQTGGATPVATNVVQYACPASDGTISAWTTSAAPLTANIMNLALATYNSYLFGVGGYTGAAYQATAQIAHVNNGGNGMTGANGTTTTAMTSNGTTAAPRYFHATVAYNGYLYALGGYTGSAYLNTVVYAPITGPGTVGAWATTSAFTNNRAYSSVAVYNGRLYLTGGYNGTTFFGDYQYSTVQSDGTLGPWSTSANIGATATPRATHGSVAYNGYLYVVGGLSTTTTYLSTVQYAPINADGSVGTWASTTALPGIRATSVAVAYNGFIYVLGGRTAASTYINSVVMAPLSPTGGIGTAGWTYTSSFKNTRNYLGTAVANGFLYIFGGWDGTTYYQDIQYAVITSNGTLGPWQNAGNMSSSRYGVSSAYYDGYMYVTGGNAAGTASAVVDYLPLQNIQRIGRYTKLLDLGNAVGNVNGFTVNGLVPGQSGALSYRVAASDGVFSSSNFLSTNIQTANCSVVARYVLLVLVLDDSGDKYGGAGVFPDTGSTNAYSTDITVLTKFGHPPPQIRLRHGATMQVGALSPLDTCNTIPG